MFRLQIRPSNSVNGHSIVYRDSSLLGIPPFIDRARTKVEIDHQMDAQWHCRNARPAAIYAARSVLERMGRSIKSFFLPESSSVNTSALYRWVDGMSVCVAPENGSCFLDKKEHP